MNTTSTPPVLRKVIFSYDENKFAKTIARFTEDLLKSIKIGVWAHDPKTGKCTNILESTSSGDELDNLIKNAAYTTFEGHPIDLFKIGIV